MIPLSYAGLFLLMYSLVGLWVGRWWVLRRARVLTGDMEGLIQSAAGELQAQRQETERARLRADSYGNTIAGCVTEAQTSKELYLTAVSQGAAAQAILFREIERLTLLYRRAQALHKTSPQAELPELRPDPLVSRVMAELHGETQSGPPQ